MRRATVSLVGLYNYDQTIFDGLLIPEAIDRGCLIDNLLLEAAPFEILYPRADFLKTAIAMWSKKQLPVWQDLYETTLLEYDPLYNFDRHEEYTDTETVSASSSSESSSTSSASAGSKVAGFNAVELVDNASSSSTGNAGETSSVSGETSRSLGHTARLFGNIGVTTSQQMLEAEREVVRFNVIDVIIKDFIDRFCILVY